SRSAAAGGRLDAPCSGLRGQLVDDDPGLEGGRAEQVEVGDVEAGVLEHVLAGGQYREDPEVLLVDKLVLKQRLGERPGPVIDQIAAVFLFEPFDRLGGMALQQWRVPL